MRAKFTKGLLMTALITGTLACAVGAQAEEIEEYSLDQMVVTAQRMETKEIDTPAAVEVLTNEQLLATGANNMQEALRFGTGLMFQSQGPKGTSQGTMSSKIVIRGVEKGTLVLIDGVPMNQMGRYNLENISPENVEKVEIIRGGGSVLYGSEASGGVINIITKEKVKNTVKTAWGNYGMQSHTASIQAGDLGLSYTYDKLGKVDDISDPAGGKPAGNFYNINRVEHNNFNLRYNINDRLFFTHSYSENNSHYVYRYKPQNSALNKDAIYTTKEHMSQLHYKDDSFKATLAYTYRDFNNLSKVMQSKRQGSKYTYFDKLDRITNSGHKDKTISLDMQKNWELDKDVAIIGMSFQRDTTDKLDDEYSISKKNYTITEHDYERNMYSVYGQYNYAMSKASNLIVSARGTWTAQTKHNNTKQGNFSKFTPEVEYITKLNEDTSFYAKAGQSFMMPTFTQMFGSGNMVGNPDLKPQHGNHYEIGFKKNIDNQAWRLAIFNYSIKDSIEAKWARDSSTNATAINYTNEDIRNTGIELTWNTDMENGWKANAGITYSNPEKYTTKTEWNVVKPGSWTRYYGRVQLNGGLNYSKDKLSSALNVNYICKRTRDIADQTPMKPYLFTNLNVSYKPTTDSKFFLNIDNLLNRKDITTAATSSFYTLGRNFMVGYEYSF